MTNSSFLLLLHSGSTHGTRVADERLPRTTAHPAIGGNPIHVLFDGTPLLCSTHRIVAWHYLFNATGDWYCCHLVQASCHNLSVRYPTGAGPLDAFFTGNSHACSCGIFAMQHLGLSISVCSSHGGRRMAMSGSIGYGPDTSLLLPSRTCTHGL